MDIVTGYDDIESHIIVDIKNQCHELIRNMVKFMPLTIAEAKDINSTVPWDIINSIYLITLGVYNQETHRDIIENTEIIIDEYNSGQSIKDISLKWKWSPFKIIKQIINGKEFKELMNRNFNGFPERDVLEFKWVLENDVTWNSGDSKFKYLETAFGQWIHQLGISFLTENELLAEGRTETPDFLIKDPIVRINGAVVNWLEFKSYYGFPNSILTKKNKRQMQRFNTAYGPGQIVYLLGKSAGYFGISLRKFKGQIESIADQLAINEKEIIGEKREREKEEKEKGKKEEKEEKEKEKEEEKEEKEKKEEKGKKEKKEGKEKKEKKENGSEILIPVASGIPYYNFFIALSNGILKIVKTDDWTTKEHPVIENAFDRIARYLSINEIKNNGVSIYEISLNSNGDIVKIVRSLI